MMNVHASGGEAMLRAAREAWRGRAPAAAHRGHVLTSLADADLARVGFTGSPRERRAPRAPRARDAAWTAWCAPRRRPAPCARPTGADFLLVTPGIRLEAHAATTRRAWSRRARPSASAPTTS
jgi:orotidine-5'-phosphate decarboxylase